MKSTFKLIAIVLLFTSGSANSQDSNLGVAQANNRLTSRSAMLYDAETAYLSKEWSTGRVFFLDGKKRRPSN